MVAGDGVTSATVILPWPDKRLHAHAKGHWRPKAAATRRARGNAYYLALEAGVKAIPGPHRLIFTFHPPDRRRRDVSNTVQSLKAHIDGIADALGVDDSTFRVRWPEAFDGVAKGGQVVVEVTTAQDESGRLDVRASAARTATTWTRGD